MYQTFLTSLSMFNRAENEQVALKIDMCFLLDEPVKPKTSPLNMFFDGGKSH